jgi:hypothetical protein
MSGDLTELTNMKSSQTEAYFSPSDNTERWKDPLVFKRYKLQFPFYPFRTLCPCDMTQTKMIQDDFNTTSPLFPAHTQLNIVFKRRPDTNLLNYMLPEDLDTTRGSTYNTLTLAHRQRATQFTSKQNITGADTATDAAFTITTVSVVLRDCYLQVPLFLLTTPPSLPFPISF